MARSSGRWLLTASLIGVLSATAPVLAQAGRPWVDPPSENGTTPSTSPTPAPPALPAQAATPAPATPPAPPPSSASAPTEAPKEKEAVASRPPAESPPRKEVAGEQAEKTVAERKIRRPTQQARTSTRPQKREQKITRRREPALDVSQSRAPRNGIERRARITRYGSAQEGVDAGLQVMRLRTIQLPDGRRIEILTRPNQDIAGELPDGY